MHKLSHKDSSSILNMLDAVNKIFEYSDRFKNADEFYEHSMSFDAVMMNFVVIGEMVDRLSDDILKETAKKIDWAKVKGFRNIIAHNYFGIDAEEVWQIINGSLKELKGNLEKLVS